MPVPTSVKVCDERLDAFINSLPRSAIHFYFFNKCNLKDPEIASNLSEWKVGGKTCYVNKGATPSWSYTYTASSLKSLFINSSTQTNVTPYEPAQQASLQDGGHGTGEMVEQGDHITIGARKYNQDPDMYMLTHKTIYKELEPTLWEREEISCKLIMTGTLQDSDKCYEMNKPLEKCDTFSKKYESDPFAMTIIKEMERVYCSTIGMAGGGTKQYIKYKGNRYLVRTGKKGGRYIQLRDGSKIYKPEAVRKHHGGNQSSIEYKGVRFSREFVEKLCEHVITPVKEQRVDLESITILYDELSQLGNGSNKYIAIIYDFHWPNSNVFYLDALTAFTACYVLTVGESAATAEERNTFNIFKNAIEPTRQIRVY
jgi:hypothetical protein